MKKRAYFGLFIIAIVLLAGHIRSPKILIIGDSISIGYTPFVEEFFSGKAIVTHNPGNAQHTGTGLRNIEEWVGNEAGRYKEDAKKYNKAAKEIMKKHEILVNDIYRKSKSIHKTYGKGSDDVHYTKEGYEELGELVTNFLTTEVESIY